MVEKDYFIGGSKNPDKSVASILYRFAEENVIDKKNKEELYIEESQAQSEYFRKKARLITSQAPD